MNVCTEILSDYFMIALLMVTYNPDLYELKKTLLSIFDQVDYLLVVDNSELDFEGDVQGGVSSCCRNTVYISSGGNVGIAKAQNIGLKIISHFKYVFLSDQDTVYPKSYVKDMICFSDENKSDLLFPTVILDSNKENSFYYDEGLLFFKKCKMSEFKDDFSVAQGISSGSLISENILKSGIFMKEDLFIDWVDFEWCWRIRKSGYVLKQAPKIFIKHSLGDNNETFFSKSIYRHEPIRHYYILRNAMHLSMYSCLSFRYRVSLFIKSISYLVLYPIIFTPRIKNFCFVVRAIKDAITHRMGRKET